MPSINELNLPDDRIEIPEEIPEQIRSFPTPPQPGNYRFRLPSDLTKIWESQEVKNEKVQAKIGSKTAAIAIFSEDYPLIITQSREPSHIGDSFQSRVNIAPRHRGNDIYISDMYYLLSSGLNHDMTGCKAWTQVEWARAFMTHAGKEFAAAIEWSGFCSDRRTRYILDTDGSSIEDPTGATGCGTNFYQSGEHLIPKEDDGSWSIRFTCSECEISVVRCFANLTNFRSVAK